MAEKAKSRRTRNGRTGTGVNARTPAKREPESPLPTTAPTAPTATAAGRDKLPSLASRVLTANELEVLRLVDIERADVREVAEVLNTAHGTHAWTVERVVGVVERARTKLVKQGEFEAARPNAYAAQATRVRYDDIIRRMYDELDNLVGPEFASARVKMLRAIADVERLRDEGLRAYQPSSLTLNAGVAYVSHLRTPAPNAPAHPRELTDGPNA